MEYSVGFAITQGVRDAIALVPKDVWSVALDADGQVREHADVVEITGLLPARIRQAWPADMRVIIRREHPHPGAQLSLFEAEHGWRYQAVATNTAAGQVSFLQARHRAHARVQDRIRVAKDMGLGRYANPWAAELYQRARDRGHDHPHAVRILGRAWANIIWRCWQDHTSYEPDQHRALQRVLNAATTHAA